MGSELLTLLNAFLHTGQALAQVAPVVEPGQVAAVVKTTAISGKDWFLIATTFIAGLAMAMATIGTGIGMGIAISKACEGIARQPEAEGKIRTTMIIGLAMIESLAIYSLVVVLILLYANPLLGKF